ncbi:hypothetical protein [Sphingobium algorifonticola]|uniref:Uncharacterized protein n=1 Tax=Sphingobium algorifonticola TaxID=2008318 RepID=A0A437J9C1_9SPHN|nr:hypothetical protein [Sphingobium algorifonticola]RVT42106.1 hypothetical protein ENE74_07715 [Sphingobium algorifonticola]
MAQQDGDADSESDDSESDTGADDAGDRRTSRSFRANLRAFQRMHGGNPSPGFVADLEYLENRDLDLSIRLGAMLAFNALLITIGTHPISASPGAPLSIDAATHPAQTIASLIGILPFAWSSLLLLRALMVGEEFETCGEEGEEALRVRLLAAFVRSVDLQSRFLRRAVWGSIAGGGLTMIVWAWIMGAKMLA